MLQNPTCPEPTLLCIIICTVKPPLNKFCQSKIVYKKLKNDFFFTWQYGACLRDIIKFSHKVFNKLQEIRSQSLVPASRFSWLHLRRLMTSLSSILQIWSSPESLGSWVRDFLIVPRLVARLTETLLLQPRSLAPISWQEIKHLQIQYNLKSLW